MSELKQLDGESPAQWLDRLRQLGPDTLSEHQRFFLLQHALGLRPLGGQTPGGRRELRRGLAGEGIPARRRP